MNIIAKSLGYGIFIIDIVGERGGPVEQNSVPTVIMNSFVPPGVYFEYIHTPGSSNRLIVMLSKGIKPTKYEFGITSDEEMDNIRDIVHSYGSRMFSDRLLMLESDRKVFQDRNEK